MLRQARSTTNLVTRLFLGGAQARQCGIAAQAAAGQQLLARHVACSAAAAAALQSTNTFNIMLPMQLGIAARFLSSSSAAPQQEGSNRPQQQQQQQQQQPAKEAFDSLELTEEKINAVTDKIPQKPVTIVEGTSYMVIILGAFAVLVFFIYNFVTNFILEPTYQTCFNTTLQRLKLDPRITVRLGNDIVGYGQESPSRVQRQQIPHELYKDANGTEHCRLQFNMRGPGGVAIVNADMSKDSSGSWDYLYLIVDVKSGSSPPQRLNIVSPK